MKLNQAAYDMLAPLPLFSPIMRKANREGKKTQTRRILKLPKWSTGDFTDLEFQLPLEAGANVPMITNAKTLKLQEIQCPHGSPSDLRYMREPLFKGEDGFAYYVDDDGTRNETSGLLSISALPSMYINAQRVTHLLTGDPVKWIWKIGTLSGVYMPKYAARLFKRIRSVRVERLQEITLGDIAAEGWHNAPQVDRLWLGEAMRAQEDGFAWYMNLWDSLNAKRGYPWDSNPYIWVIGYADDQTITAAQAQQAELPA